MQLPDPPFGSTDRWGALFHAIDHLLLFTPAMADVWGEEGRLRFLEEIKEPLHTQAYDLGRTRYLPVSRVGPDDLVS